jgi:N-acetylglucosaminyl-diphospho-decaprenol L-rhamnosyltransferase
MRIDYVIIAFRSEHVIGPCLDSIAADRPDGSQILVVDNASPDRSAALAQAHPSGPTVIALPLNGGFGAGCNAATAYSNAEAVFLVNPDARLVTGATRVLVERLAGDPSLALVGPQIVDPRREVVSAAAGAEPSLRSVAGHYLFLSRIPGVGSILPPLHLRDPNLPAKPDWASGAAMLVRRIAFDEVGGFDTRLFLYMEDVDLCRRLRMAGWQIGYEPRAVVEHDIGGSQGHEQAATWYRAFHQYLVVQRGDVEARISSFVAALGLAGRAAVSAPYRPRNARRMARAAGAALTSAILPRRQAATAAREAQ